MTAFKIPFNNYKISFNKYVFNKWQTLWKEALYTKLKEIEPLVNHKRLLSKLSRREVILACLRMGHTRITHSWLLNRDKQPHCIGCNTPFTTRHYLLDCTDFDVNNLNHLFTDVSVENILSFLKNVNLFNKI